MTGRLLICSRASPELSYTSGYVYAFTSSSTAAFKSVCDMITELKLYLKLFKFFKSPLL